MTPTVVRCIDLPPQPWRNGGGTTRELLAWPAGEAWQVRVSVADIEVDGPFSAYSGVQRWFSVLQGAGVELSIDGAPQRLHRGDPPLQFGGDAVVGCHLIDGPTRDLNLMLRHASGWMQAATDGQAWSPAATQCGLFTAVAGVCQAGTQQVALSPYALLWFDTAPPSLTFTAGQRPAALIGWWLAATPLQAQA
jgi:environmental stress-induced protein Ves